MENVVVHRIIEDHAATHGDAAAIVHHGNIMTYRHLNHQANTLARHLMEQGFHRGAHVIVTMPPGHRMATVLLGILKAGGAFTWDPLMDADARSRLAWSERIGDGRSHRLVDLATILDQPLRCSPNLPILTRPTDIACVLASGGDARGLLVPHSTITALRRDAPASPHSWVGETSTFDLWTGLMAGATLETGAASALRDAA